jgi:hypothetical protein
VGRGATSCGRCACLGRRGRDGPDGRGGGPAVGALRPQYSVVTSCRFLPVLWRQVHSPLLVLLLAAALASYFVGEGTDALIIAVIDAG